MTVEPRLAHALEIFRRQIDDAAPARSTASDGWIADKRHVDEAAAHPDEQPWDVTQHIPNAAAVVCAIDVTHDPAAGADCAQLFAGLCASTDPRIFYAIFDGRIRNSDGTVTDYHGVDDHSRHLHLSSQPNRPDLYDNPAPWDLTRKEHDEMPLSQDDLDAIADRVAEKLYADKTGRGKWNLQAIYAKAASVDHRVDVIDDTVVNTGRDTAAALQLLHQLADVILSHPQAAPAAAASYDDHVEPMRVVPTI